MTSITQQARQAMNTKGQKSCLVFDRLVEALAGDPSSNLRRAIILSMIDQTPGVTQTKIMNELGITKSAMNREIEWLFNYGCVRREEDKRDGRAIGLEVVGYSRRALHAALDYFPNRHEGLHYFVNQYIIAIKQERPTLRDAKILATLYDKRKATKTEVLENLYSGPATTDNRAYKKLVEDGMIENGER